MSYIKKPEEVQKIIEGGKILGEVLEQLASMVKPGMSTLDVDQEAERLIVEAGGRPAFKGYKTRKSDPEFPATICASLNAEIVHGIPSAEKILREGDIFSIDIGMVWPYRANSKLQIPNSKNNDRGYFTDTAVTVPVGKTPKQTHKLIDVTREALEVGIEAVQIGNSIADIGQAIEEYVKSQGKYGIVEGLSGHGVGHAVHEDPWVPNYYVEELEDWIIKPGVVIAIEPMISLGTWNIKVLDDKWTIATADGSLSAHFEHTIAVTEDGPVVVTRRPAEL